MWLRKPVSLEIQHLGESLSELTTGSSTEGTGGEPVGPGGPTDTRIDSAWLQRVQRTVLLNHAKWNVIGKHDTTCAEPDPLGDASDLRDQEFWRCAGDGRHPRDARRTRGACSRNGRANLTRSDAPRSASQAEWPEEIGVTSSTDSFTTGSTSADRSWRQLFDYAAF